MVVLGGLPIGLLWGDCIDVTVEWIDVTSVPSPHLLAVDTMRA